MPEPIRKGMKVGVTQPDPPEKEKEPQKEVKKEEPKEKLKSWNFPLQGRSVRARNLAEATKIINAKK